MKPTKPTRRDPRWRVALVFAPDDPRLAEVQRSAELGRTGVSDRILELARTGMLAEEELRTARLPRTRQGAEVRILGACTANIRLRLSVERDKLLAEHLRQWETQNNRPASARLLRLLELGILMEGAARPAAAPTPAYFAADAASHQRLRERPVPIDGTDGAVASSAGEHNTAADIHRAILAASW